MTSIDEVIQNADLEDGFHVWRGQCLSIAMALRDYFGGDLIVASEIPGEGFDHALIEIDGELYDGSGHVGWTETVTRFIAPEAQQEDIDAHFYKPDELTSSLQLAFDEETYEAVYERLESEAEP